MGGKLALSVLGAALFALFSGHVATAQTAPTLEEGLSTAWKRGCLTDVMGMTERARSVGMGPEAYGIKPLMSLPSKSMEAALTNGGAGSFSKLETTGGPIWIASVSGLQQPVCTVAVYDADARAAAQTLLAELSNAPWAKTAEQADYVEYSWKANGRPTLSVALMAPGMGLLANGVDLPAPDSNKGVQLTVLTGRAND